MIRYIKSRRMRLSEYVACIRETNISPKKTRPFERPRRKLEAKNKTDPIER
jgi:hypothetical protein